MQKFLFYTQLAKYYDKIYHNTDFKEQEKFFEKVTKEFNKAKNNKILDVACGTGIHADLLQRKGFKVTGFDISKEMLTEAKKRNAKIRLIQGDMKTLHLNKKFGTIICFFNSILYNKNQKEMKKTLSNFYGHLEKGGILIFDVVDRSIGINFEKEEYKYEKKGLKIIFKPQWIYAKEKKVMNLDLDFVINGKQFHENHAMGAFGFSQLKKLLQKIGFEVFVLERNFKAIKKFNSTKKMAIFVCRK